MQTIVVKEVGKEPTKLNVRDGQLTLELLQRLVGGYIEVVHPDGFPQDVVLICNEEGKLRDLPFNFYLGDTPIVGNVVFCGQKRQDLGSLSLNQIAVLMDADTLYPDTTP